MQERAVKTRERILKSSLHLFARYGYHGTSVDRIAKESNANKQRIYQYFKNKKSLFETCLIKSFENIAIEELDLINELGCDCANMTEVILRHYMKLHEKHPDFWKLISWANLESEPFYKCLKNIKAENYTKLNAVYEKGQEKGIFRKDISFEVYMFILFAVTYFYRSNQKTLSSTLNSGLFTHEGADKIVSSCAMLLSTKGVA